MRGALRKLWKASAALLLLALLLVGAAWVAGNSGPGRALLERLTVDLTAGHVRPAGLGGEFPARLTLRRLELVDAAGVWLTADGISLAWSPLRLLQRRIDVTTLQVAQIDVARAPRSGGPGGGSATFPEIDVGRFDVTRLRLGAALVGAPATLSLGGTLRLRSLLDADAEVVAHRIDGDGEYSLTLRFDPQRMDAALELHEPAGGPFEHLLAVPGLGALSASATVNGPRASEHVEVTLTAGPLQGRAHGVVDLLHEAAELDYSLQAPAMTPNAALAWKALALSGTWRGPLTAPVAAGHLQIDGLQLADAGGARKLTADLKAAGGKLSVQSRVEGLRLPGPAPQLLEGDALQVDGSMQLNVPTRPFDLRATHRLVSLHARGDTAPASGSAAHAVLEATIPDLAPFAAAVAQDVRGSGTLSAKLAYGAGDDSAALDATALLTGGGATWLKYAGPKLDLQLAAVLAPDSVKVQDARLTGNGLTLGASGSVSRSLPMTLQARYQLSVAELRALAADLGGDLEMSGQVTGPLGSLSADAELRSRVSVRGSAPGEVTASVRARGLPNAPSGTVRASGLLDAAPLEFDATLDRAGRDALRLAVRRADWKSVHAEGDLTADAALTRSHGQLSLHIGELADFGRLLGTTLAGSLDGRVALSPLGERTQVQLDLQGQDLLVGRTAGEFQLHAAGASNAVALDLKSRLPKLYGGAAVLTAAATLDADARTLRFADADVEYRGAAFKLLAPAQVSYGDGIGIDSLRMGARGAVLEVTGQVAPSLDLHAALTHVDQNLLNVFTPGLVATADVAGQLRLKGSSAGIGGELQLDAADVTFADDAATGLPPLEVHAHADLDAGMATVSGRLAAGTASEVTVSGTAPLGAGPVDVKIGGKMDLSLANPLLEARGLRGAGKITVDASVTGDSAAPQVGGGMVLTQGSLRDYVRGTNLSNIEANLVGNEAGLTIKSFTAKAVSGTVGVTGSFGVFDPGMPLDLHIVAKNAQPVASNLVTANLDADVRVSGKARERIDVAGTVHLNRATIYIPDSFPPEVAVLDVRRRGQAAQPASGPGVVIGIDLALNAPQDIFVKGRGLDAQLGGDIKITGTSDAPVATGSFDLQRGTFELAGTKLNFTEGRVSFDGAGLRKKIDPTLDFTANTTVSDTTVVLKITGIADAPRFDFSSTPQLPQDEIMARLLFGESAAQLSALQVAQIGAALATLGGVGGNSLNPLAKLQRSLGLDRLTVGTNTTTSATGAPETSGYAIAAGRYVTKRVYVEGKQTTTGTSQVQVAVDLTKHLKLQTRLGNGNANVQGTTPENDPGSSVGLIYQFEY